MASKVERCMEELSDLRYKIGNIVSDLNETFEEIDEKISEVILEVAELDIEE